ncbi:MAG: hypothetical protein GC164_08130 [Phycisphaera sp.]|nr:hypothetical protein [Phycisphaera sp.]
MPSAIPQFDPGRFQVVAIASSTGGPGLVEQIMAGLPADLPVPVLIAQHLPPTFTPLFAQRLATVSPLAVVHAEDRMPIHPGVAYVGVGHQHMRVIAPTRTQRLIEISPEPTALRYRPSADELFRSCATVYGRAVLAVVMTGIGQDGLAGASAVHAVGGVVVTQSAKTCVVYGMPKACDEAGISSASLDPDAIRRTILQLSPQHGHEAMAAR